MAKTRPSTQAPSRAAGRTRFQIHLPRSAARDALATLLVTWSAEDRVHEARVPQLENGGVVADIRARRGQLTAPEMRAALVALKAAHPGVRVAVHECRHEIDGGPCDQPEEL